MAKMTKSSLQSQIEDALNGKGIPEETPVPEAIERIAEMLATAIANAANNGVKEE